MCRDVAHGGRRCPTESALNSAKRRVARLEAAVAREGLAPERESMLLRRLLVAYDRLAIARQAAENPVVLPARLVTSGAQFAASGRELRCAVPGGVYSPNKHRPVVNRERGISTTRTGRRRTRPPGKPVGGLWFSTVDEDGVSEWAWKCGYRSDFESARTSPYTVQVADDARVVVVHTWQDYTDLVDACGRDVPSDYGDALVRRGIDYERLPADVIFIDERAIYEDKNRRYRPDGWPVVDGEHPAMVGYESIEGWDISSGVVLNRRAVTLTPLLRDAAEAQLTGRPSR